MHIQTNSSGKANNAFTLMEMLITLAVVGILSAASAPLITQALISITGTDKNVTSCITANNTSAWYNTTTGVAAVPNSGTDPACYAAVTDTQYDKGAAYATVSGYANHGTAAQKTTAKQILRAACDQGGTKACDYFINKCQTDGSTNSPYCNDTASFTDLTYYLKLLSATYTNSGATYMVPILQSLVTKPITNITYEALVDCTHSDDPVLRELACDIATPSNFIAACNTGNNAFACAVGHALNFNRSCNQIKTTNHAATTGQYKLTYNDPTGATTIPVTCDMTSAATGAYALASEAISGCDVSVPDDCNYGYNNSYNRSCNKLKTAWSAVASLTAHKLTYLGLPYNTNVIPSTVTNPLVSISTCDMTSAATGAYALASEAISGCDASVPDDCTYGYNNNLNKGCNQVFTATSPTTGTVSHKLTSTGAGTPVSTSCTMTTGDISSAAITGCNTGNVNDCAYGYTNSKNRSCANIASTWSAYTVGGTYNITTGTSAWSSSPCPKTIPDDPACGTTTIGGIKVALCATGNYSGCSGSDACTPDGASNSCAAMNTGINCGTHCWRLPTMGELSTFGPYLGVLGACNGCEYAVGGPSAIYYDIFIADLCVWNDWANSCTQDRAAYKYWGTWNPSNLNNSLKGSFRCVRNL